MPAPAWLAATAESTICTGVTGIAARWPGTLMPPVMAHEQSRADAAFHGAIARGARNATLERQWTFLEPYSRTFITLSRPGTDLVALAEEHQPILDALRARDGRRAGKAMHRHLMLAAKHLRDNSPA